MGNRIASNADPRKKSSAILDSLTQELFKEKFAEIISSEKKEGLGKNSLQKEEKRNEEKKREDKSGLFTQKIEEAFLKNINQTFMNINENISKQGKGEKN